MDANERRTRATNEATQWWNRLAIERGKQISKADRELFTQWLRDSPLHVAELLRVAQVHDSLERFKLWSEIDTDTASETHNVIALHGTADTANEVSSGKPPDRSRMKIWAMAASSCLIAVVAGWLALGARGYVIETDLAERRQVMLSDGSVVQLEPETMLRVKFEDNERRVELESGRAMFRVAKDAQRPFLVNSGQTSVRAVGTQFGVESGSRGVIVTVAEGKVAVGREGRVIHAASPPEIVLTAGQQLTVQSSGVVKQVRTVDTVRALAWAEGQLVFENDTLIDVVTEINRYNHAQLRIDDPQLGARRVSGVFEATDTETLLTFIRHSGTDISITRTEEGIVIGSRSR